MASDCRKVGFINESSGEVTRIPCGRRSCPRCRASYAVKTGSAIEACHGKKATHLVFTLRDLEGFPTEGQYVASKSYTRALAKVRKATEDFNLKLYHEAYEYYMGRVERIPRNILDKIRAKIKKGSERVSRGRRDLCRIVGDYMGRDPESIGWIRAIEFGTKNTHRFHAHVVLMVDFWPVMQALDEAGCVYEYDEKEDIYVFKDTPFWPWGAVRVCGLSRAKGAIEYISEYSTKCSPGRITIDKNSSRMKRSRQEVISKVFRAKYGNLDEKIQYVPIGAEERKKESVLDGKYERARARRKKRSKK